jgi:RNA helicase HrpA
MHPSPESIRALAAALPVVQHRDHILRQIAAHPVIVVESPTGSGKTTQLPRILYDAGYGATGRIGVTQPRRIAAVSVTDFVVAQLAADTPSDTASDAGGAAAVAAYKMRFEDTTTRDTRIKVMTDGVLLQELKHDRMLSEYSVLMVDEAHERSLNIDFVLGLLKGVLARRPDFKVIVSSATINAEVFSEYFDSCPIVRIDTPVHPVQIRYRPFQPAGDPEQLLAAVERIVLEIDRSRKPGDILVFLSGERDIRGCIALLAARRESRRWQLLPLYARLSRAEQDRVFDDFPERRKIVVATNIAETSITIPGIGYVIDSGLAKINSFNTRTLTAALTEQPISHASCNQRRGRAGRTGPGTCYRLYSEASYQRRPLFETEEIHRTDLSEVVLRMAELDITEFEEFDFLSSPGRDRIASAVALLGMLDALDGDRALTEIGRTMVKFPILPRHARILVEAIYRYPEVLEEAIIAVAFLSVPSPFIMPEGHELEARHAHHAFRDPLGDLVACLDLYRRFRDSSDRDGFCTRHYLEPRTMYEILNVKEQLEEIVSGLGVPVSGGGPVSHYLRAVGRGLMPFICVAAGPGRYRSPTAGNIFIHPGSGMYQQPARFIVAGEIMRTARAYARSVSPLTRDEVRAISPDLLADLLAVSREGTKGARRRGRAQERGAGTDRAGRRGRGEGNNAGHQLHLLGRVFEVTDHRSKRPLVTLPWHEAAPIARRAGRRALAPYRTWRGRITLDSAEVMAGARLAALFEVLAKIDPAHRIDAGWPRDTMRLPQDTARLLDCLGDLLAMSVRRPAARKLGFIALQTDAGGAFWLSLRRNLQNAVTDSLAALEALADAPEGALDHAQQARVSAVYRRVANLL